MVNLGEYYQNKNNHVFMVKYYYLAIKNNSKEAMNNLANYYDSVNDNESILKMGIYFEKIKKHTVALECYYVATQQHNFRGWYKRGKLYELLNLTDQMVECYLKAIEYGCVKSVYNLATHYMKIKKYDQMLTYFSIYITNSEIYKINEIINICL